MNASEVLTVRARLIDLVAAANVYLQAVAAEDTEAAVHTLNAATAALVSVITPELDAAAVRVLRAEPGEYGHSLIDLAVGAFANGHDILAWRDKLFWRAHALAKLAAMIPADAIPNDDAGEVQQATCKPDKRKLATVNARMVDLLGKKPESAGWTVKEWATELRCAQSTVTDTNVWKSMKMDRETRKAERATKRARDKRRK